MSLPHPNPIDAEWLVRGAPLDLIATDQIACISCNTTTTQDLYRTMMEGYGGVGAPFFITPFIRRRSTSGKLGKKSEWIFCRECQSFRPQDQNAREYAERMGLPEGFDGKNPWS